MVKFICGFYKKDENGNRVFTTDRDFKVVQLTDVHIGAGYMSYKKDLMAFNAVASMITREKPDLVIVTGDMSYPVPFSRVHLITKTLLLPLPSLWKALVYIGQ